MQAFSIAFHAIVPLFLIIALGYLTKRIGWLNQEDVRRFNRVTFYTFMPVMLFYNIYSSDFSQAVRAPYVLMVASCAVGTILLSIVITLPLEKEAASAATLCCWVCPSPWSCCPAAIWASPR